MLCGVQKPYGSFLQNIIDDEGELSTQAEILLERLKAYEAEVPADMEPVVKILYSEHEKIPQRKYMPIGEFDKLVSDLDYNIHGPLCEDNGKEEESYSVRFRIYYPENGKMQSLDEKINIGDGTGGVIATLKAHVDIRLHDEDWISYKKGQGEQAFSKYISELNELQDHVLPYLQQYCSLPEQEPIKTASIAKREKQQLSIHDRLEKNKEVLEKKPGKDIEKKGVEL